MVFMLIRIKCMIKAISVLTNRHVRMGITKDENKDTIDFSLRLCARYIFFPQRRRDAEKFLYFHIN